MRLGLDMPGRTTRDYEGPAVAPRVQAALDAAMLNVEPDVDIDVGALMVNSVKAVRGQKKGSRAAGLVDENNRDGSDGIQLGIDIFDWDHFALIYPPSNHI